MSIYAYQVRDRSGKLFTGQVEGDTLRDAAAKLRDDGFFIINIESAVAAATQKAQKEVFSLGGKVKLRDLLLFTKQFGVMIKAGLNLVHCLELLADQIDNLRLSQTINEVRKSVEKGETLHVALSKYPKIFPPIYIYMVEAGEASGQLELVLQRLVEYLERDFELKKKVSGAMIYPSVIIFVAIIVVVGLMAFVIPQFVQMFADSEVELPVITQVLITVSDFMKDFWYLILFALFAVVVGIKYYRDTPPGRKVTDKILYNMNIIGPVIKKTASARFSRTLATLLDSGVMITKALELVEKAVDNSVIAEAIENSRINITKGSGMAQPLTETKVFPELVTQMIAVGEETGEIGGMLNEVADFYEKEAGYAVESITSLIEPAIIVGLGGTVAVIVLAIMLPLFDISTGAMIR